MSVTVQMVTKHFINSLLHLFSMFTRSKMLMDNDTQTFSNMHFYTLMDGLNRFDFHHGKPWQWLNKHYERWAFFLLMFLEVLWRWSSKRTRFWFSICWGHYYTRLKYFHNNKPCCSSSIMLSMSPHAFVLFNPPSFASLRESHSNCMEWGFQVNDRWPHKRGNSSKPMHLW